MPHDDVLFRQRAQMLQNHPFVQSAENFCPLNRLQTQAYTKQNMLESEPTRLKWVGDLYIGSKANIGHNKMTLRTHHVVKTACSEKLWLSTTWFLEISL